MTATKSSSPANILTPGIEDYLETILILKSKKKVVRVKNIADFLKVKASSVINALKTLVDKELIIHERYGYIELTKKGKREAKEIYKKHKTLSKFFHKVLDVNLEIATKDACKMEHFIHKETLDGIAKFIKFIESCFEGEPGWPKNFYHFVKYGKCPKPCLKRKNDRKS